MVKFTVALLTLLVAALIIPVALGGTDTAPADPDPVPVDYAGQYYRRWLSVSNVFCADQGVDVRGMVMEWNLPERQGAVSFTRYLNGAMISGEVIEAGGARVMRADAVDRIPGAVYPFTYEVVTDTLVSGTKTYTSSLRVRCTAQGPAASFTVINTPAALVPAVAAAH